MGGQLGAGVGAAGGAAPPTGPAQPWHAQPYVTSLDINAKMVSFTNIFNVDTNNMKRILKG